MECRISNCEGNIKAKGLCEKHYARQRRNGDPNKLRRDTIKLCEVDECFAKHEARGYCREHYRKYIERPNRRKRKLK